MNHSGTDVEEAIANNDLLSDSQMLYMSLCSEMNKTVLHKKDRKKH